MNDLQETLDSLEEVVRRETPDCPNHANNQNAERREKEEETEETVILLELVCFNNEEMETGLF